MRQNTGGLLDPGPGDALVAHDRARPRSASTDAEQVQGLPASVQLLGSGVGMGEKAWWEVSVP
ncbi:hypothetical protein GCM10027294_12910 [Marinactinospora endophytica]